LLEAINAHATKGAIREGAKGAESLPSLTKDMQTEQLLCWSGMADTEHSTTSSSNEEEEECSIAVTVGLRELPDYCESQFD